MATLTTLNFTQIVQNSAAAAQAACSTALDYTVGSVLRALTEGTGALVMWMQYLILSVLQASRLSTATGSDVDTYVADFGLTRSPATAATGVVTFARAGVNYPALVLPGAQVKSTDGTFTFLVTKDVSNTFWNAGLGGYVIPIGTQSADLPVAADTGGAAYNVQAGFISLLATSIPGVETVTNATAFANGQDAETDAALKQRFQLTIDGLSKATESAVGAAVLKVQPGLTYEIQSNTAPDGSFLPGNFLLTVDDGSGNPPPGLLSAIYTAVDAVRSVCETFVVAGPTVIYANITLTITVGAGVSKPVAQGLVATAITAFVNSLPVGTPLPYSYLAKLAFDAMPSGQIVNVSSIVINNLFGDAATIVPGPTGVVRAGTVAVN